MIVRSQNYTYKGKAAFLLSIEWCYTAHKYIIKSNISQSLISKVTLGLEELNGQFNALDKDKAMNILDEVAQKIFQIEEAKHFFFNEYFSGVKGRLINQHVNQLIYYQNTIHKINVNFVDEGSNPILSYLLQCIAMSGLHCYDKYIKYLQIPRNEFESKLTSVSEKNIYVNYFNQIHSTVLVICDCNQLPSYYAAFNKQKQLLMAIIM